MIGVNEALLMMLIAFLPESKLWLGANRSDQKTLLQRLQNIRLRPHQGLRRVSITINNFFSRSNSSSNQSLPGIELKIFLRFSWEKDFSVFELNKGLDTIKCDSTSSDEIPDRQKFSIFSRVRKSSIQSLRSLSFSFRELFASKKMVQITLIQSVGWIAAAIVLQGLSSENSLTSVPKIPPPTYSFNFCLGTY